jgi:hypothetical protein
MADKNNIRPNFSGSSVNTPSAAAPAIPTPIPEPEQANPIAIAEPKNAKTIPCVIIFSSSFYLIIY